MSNSSTPSAAAGWYPDPAGSARSRWWDGTQWTEHYYDPALCGRWSFRSVMGAVAPGLRAGVFDRRDPTCDAGDKSGPK